jgi:hypothetical protein
MKFPAVSLLWPSDESDREYSQSVSQQAASDLGIDSLVERLCSGISRPAFVRDTLLHPCMDPETIRCRQQVLADLVGQPSLVDRIRELLPKLDSIRQYRRSQESGELLQEVSGRLGELETYSGFIGELGASLSEVRSALGSDGLLGLCHAIDRIQSEPAFQRLVKELPGLLSRIRSIASVTIGVNLDDRLQPQAATLLSVNAEKFRGSSAHLFRTLFGPGEAAAETGIAPLHSMPKRADGAAGDEEGCDNPRLVPLFRDLSEVLDKVCRPIEKALRGFISVNTAALLRLGDELRFFIGAAMLTQRIISFGLPMCAPDVSEKGERQFRVSDIFDLNLAFRFAEERESQDLAHAVVTNAVTLGFPGCIFILTGPNKGGKTTYMKAVGAAQILAQAGLFVPGRKARISPADGIFTHFPLEEKPEKGAGRLGEEAERLAAIFSEATPFSLILLNESLANTNPRESLHISRDVVRALMLLGARSIFTTHHHELANQVESLNSETPSANRAVSMVSLTGEVSDAASPASGNPEGGVKRTFKIVPREPAGRSYAGEIARQYGISFEQLRRKLKERGFA